MLEEHVVPNWLEEHITRSNRDKAVAEKSGKLFISYMIHADSKRKVGFSWDCRNFGNFYWTNFSMKNESTVFGFRKNAMQFSF